MRDGLTFVLHISIGFRVNFLRSAVSSVWAYWERNVVESYVFPSDAKKARWDLPLIRAMMGTGLACVLIHCHPSNSWSGPHTRCYSAGATTPVSLHLKHGQTQTEICTAHHNHIFNPEWNNVGNTYWAWYQTEGREKKTHSTFCTLETCPPFPSEPIESPCPPSQYVFLS